MPVKNTIGSIMVTEFLLLQLFLLFALALSLGFLYYCVQYRQKRGVTSLVVMFSGIAVWILSELIQIQLREFGLAGFGMAIRLLGVEITVLGMLFLGLEYTGRKQYLDWRVAALFFVVPMLEIGLALSPWRRLLFEAIPAESAPWGYEIGATTLFGAHVVYSYTFVVTSMVLLFVMMIRANTGYRRQLFAMLVAISAPTSVNFLFHVGVSPFDLTPVSFLVTAAVIMFATFRLRLLDAIPVARRTVLEEMEDMVVVLDENDLVITTNAAVAETFDLREPLDGESIASLFETDKLEQILGEAGPEEVAITIGDEDRTLHVNSSKITDYRGNLLARVLVCRDVTEQKQREAVLRRRETELELLKDLQSRFLRHNLRNELNVVRANAELLADMDDPEQRERYQTIIDKTDRILDWSTKARVIERLVETDRTVSRNVVAEIELLLEDLREEFPDVEFTLKTTADVWIAAVPQVDRAFWNVLDNAARYNTAADPRVEIAVKTVDGKVIVEISDNGPGLEEYEIETLQNQEESKLKHGTGLGLWLVYWVVEKSDGTLSFDAIDGTQVTLEFEQAVEPESERPAPAVGTEQSTD